MVKHYLFLFSSPIDKGVFLDALLGVGIEESQVSFDSPTRGEIIEESDSFPDLESILMPLHEDLGISLCLLCCHQNTSFEQKLLLEALAYFPNQALFPSDVILKEISFGNYSSFYPLTLLFKDVPREWMMTAGTYLRCGLDASLSARHLFIHRNTFNYRLEKFIEKTGLDIRDYHNALLLELYFQLSNVPRE